MRWAWIATAGIMLGCSSGVGAPGAPAPTLPPSCFGPDGVTASVPGPLGNFPACYPSPSAPVPAATAPVSPPASPTASPTGNPAGSPAASGGPIDESARPALPPAEAKAIFGAVEGTWSVGEQVAIYDVRERTFAGGPAGGTTSRYLRLGGLVYGIHWDDRERFAALTPGTTVNLHPAEHVVCQADGARCWRLMHVFPGDRFQPPLR